MLKLIKRHAIQISPVVDENGKVVKWVAGLKKYAHWWGGNYIPNNQVAAAPTLEEAVTKLLSGDVLYPELGRSDSDTI